MIGGRSQQEAFRQLLTNDIKARYRGSALGIAWPFLTPLLMLGVFTFVFAGIFKQRWPGFGGSPLDYSLIVFAGLTAFNLVADVMGRAPTIIAAQPNLVKKVVFPLVLLPAVVVGSAAFHAMIAFGVFLGMHVIVAGAPPITIVLLPFVMLPLILMALGLSWFLASLGVFIRDIPQFMNPLVTALLFLSPVFFPLSSFPEWLQGPASFNPLALTTEQLRQILIFGRMPDIGQWAMAMGIGLIFAYLGHAWFRKTSKGFADVL